MGAVPAHRRECTSAAPLGVLKQYLTIQLYNSCAPLGVLRRAPDPPYGGQPAPRRATRPSRSHRPMGTVLSGLYPPAPIGRTEGQYSTGSWPSVLGGP
jgi:hypothetical protein